MNDAWYDDPDDDDVDAPAVDDDALERCPKCHAWIYEDAEQCPECHHYLLESEREHPRHRSWWFLATVLLCLLIVLSWIVSLV